MRGRTLGALVLVTALLLTLAEPASAYLSRKDPNDIAFRGDIKRAISKRYRAPLGALPSVRWVRITIRYYDRPPWKKDHFLAVFFDTKGGKRQDYILQMFLWTAATPLDPQWPRFTCWLLKRGDGLVATYDDGVVAGKSAQSATCAFPRDAMVIRKTVKWRASASGPRFPDDFDFAPDQGWYPHL